MLPKYLLGNFEQQLLNTQEIAIVVHFCLRNWTKGMMAFTVVSLIVTDALPGPHQDLLFMRIIDFPLYALRNEWQTSFGAKLIKPLCKNPEIAQGQTDRQPHEDTDTPKSEESTSMS